MGTEKANDPAFGSAMRKVDRSRHHLAALEAEIRSYVQRDPYVLLKMRSAKTGEIYLAAVNREFPPEELSMILGDVLYNLRSALDVAANEAVRVGGVVPKKVYFPFANSAGALEEQISSKMRGATDSLKDVVRGVRPYRGGNEYLRALHDLNIYDKHVDVLGTGAGNAVEVGMEHMVQTGPHTFSVDFARIETVPIHDIAGFPITEGDEVLGKVTGGDSFVHVGPDLPFAGEDVLKLLPRLIDEVVLVIDLMKKLPGFGGAVPEPDPEPIKEPYNDQR